MAVKQYALCLTNDFGADFHGGDVIPGMVHETLGMERSLLRVVDDSGEDYLYPTAAFRLLSAEDSQVLQQSLSRHAA